MEEIATETEWLSCVEPSVLARYGHNRLDPLRFRGLVVEWGNRIRHNFNTHDRSWFAAWVAGDDQYPEPDDPFWDYKPLSNPRGAKSYAEFCVDDIRRGSIILAAGSAAQSASEDVPRPKFDVVDFTKSHRGRSKPSASLKKLNKTLFVSGGSPRNKLTKTKLIISSAPSSVMSRATRFGWWCFGPRG